MNNSTQSRNRIYHCATKQDPMWFGSEREYGNQSVINQLTDWLTNQLAHWVTNQLAHWVTDLLNHQLID